MKDKYLIAMFISVFVVVVCLCIFSALSYCTKQSNNVHEEGKQAAEMYIPAIANPYFNTPHSAKWIRGYMEGIKNRPKELD